LVIIDSFNYFKFFFVKLFVLNHYLKSFFRIGRKSARLVRAAALKLAQELFSMVKRADFAVVIRCLEG
jgi:hypothetical protein